MGNTTTRKQKKYSAKERKELEANPFTSRVTENKLYFTAEFKEKFWIRYQAGETPREILRALGYDPDMLGQKMIDSLSHRIRVQAKKGVFTEGERGGRPSGAVPDDWIGCDMTPENWNRLWHEMAYMRERVSYLEDLLAGGQRLPGEA